MYHNEFRQSSDSPQVPDHQQGSPDQQSSVKWYRRWAAVLYNAPYGQSGERRGQESDSSTSREGIWPDASEQLYRELQTTPTYQSHVAEILELYERKALKRSWETSELKQWSQTLMDAKAEYKKRVDQFQELHQQEAARDITNTRQQQVDDIHTQLSEDLVQSPKCQKIIEQYYYRKSQELSERLKEIQLADIITIRQNIERRYNTKIRRINRHDGIYKALDEVGIPEQNRNDYYILESEPCVRDSQEAIVRQSIRGTYRHAYNPDTGIFLDMCSYRDQDIKWEEKTRRENPGFFNADYPPPIHLDSIKFYHIQRATEQYMKDKKKTPRTFRPRLTTFIVDTTDNNVAVQVLKPYLSTEKAVLLAPNTRIYEIAHSLPSTESHLRIIKQYWWYFSDKPLQFNHFRAKLYETGDFIDFIHQTIIPE